MTLYCATSNHGKLREFQMAAPYVQPLPNIQTVPPCDETGSTFEENAILKAEYYGRLTDGLLFADDSGLCVNALGGEPGVYSARWAGPGATDQDNNALLLRRLADLPDRTAQFVCVIALVRAGRLLRTFRGEVQGRILNQPLGSGGFGYDPLFFYPPLNCGFAELTPDQKFEVSHRGQALRKMLTAIADQSFAKWTA